MSRHEWPQIVIHLDLDAFYAAVEALDDPRLRGEPVIVGGQGSRGVVAAASYEARRFGVHSAQAMVQAKRLCPQGHFLPVRMSRYREVSRAVFAIFSRFSPLVEPVSIDEAYLDVSGCTRLFGSPREIAAKIKAAVRDEVGLTASAGVAPSKLVAKIASDFGKPDGLTVVHPTEIDDFLAPLPISALPGVGRTTQQRLTRLGVYTIGHLRSLPAAFLAAKFGRLGIHLHEISRGEDRSRVVAARAAKSIGHEETFAADLRNLATVRRELLRLALRVGRRLRRQGMQGRRITLKVRYHDFAQVTRSETLAAPTDDGPVIFQVCQRLTQKTEAGKRPVRLLGISVADLCPADKPGQLDLFDDNRRWRRRQLNRALDTLTTKYGEKAVVPAALREG